MFKDDELKLLWPFYLMTLFSSFFSVVQPIWIAFFHHKFSFLQISIALSLQGVSLILFEAPTGSIADLFGRKLSVVSGIILQGVAWIALAFVNLPFYLYLFFFLMGLARTLESGADKAWMIDWLKDNKKDTLIHDMFIKMQSLNRAGSALGLLFSTVLLFILDMKYLFLIQGAGLLLTGFFLLFVAKEKAHRIKSTMKENFGEALQNLRAGSTLLLKNKSLLYMSLATALVSLTLDVAIVSWQPLLIALSMPTKYLGIIYSLANLIGIIIPFFTKKLLRLMGQENIYLAVTTFIQFIILLSLCLVEKPLFLFGVFIFLMIEFTRDLQLPIDYMYSQSFMPSAIRATSSSIQSVIAIIFSTIGLVAAGQIMDKTGPKMTMIYFSFLMIPATSLYLISKTGEKALPCSNNTLTPL